MGGDVVVSPCEEDVRVEPESQWELAQCLAQKVDLGPLRPLGSCIGVSSVALEINRVEVISPALRERLEPRSDNVMHERAHLWPSGGHDNTSWFVRPVDDWRPGVEDAELKALQAGADIVVIISTCPLRWRSGALPGGRHGQVTHSAHRRDRALCRHLTRVPGAHVQMANEGETIGR
jgi:hypothetical protein